MDSLLDFNFSDDSHDDYSSDLLLSDGFNSSLNDEDDALLEPKMEVTDFLSTNEDSEINFLEEPTAIDSDLFTNEQPPLPSEGMDIFELSFVPEDLDFLVKSEPIPLHCAPLPESTEKLSNKRQAPKRQAKPEAKKARTETIVPKVTARPAPRPHLADPAKKDDEKYQRRLVANKKSAQASRERKKALRSNLEDRVNGLIEDNASLALEMERLESDNKDLKRQFEQLQQVLSLQVNESSEVLSELMVEKPAEEAAASSPSASMYLLLVLYSMSQCLKTGNTTTPTLPLTTRVPSPLLA